jgi:hypothetical protein
LLPILALGSTARFTIVVTAGGSTAAATYLLKVLWLVVAMAAVRKAEQLVVAEVVGMEMGMEVGMIAVQVVVMVKVVVMPAGQVEATGKVMERVMLGWHTLQ